MGLRERIKLAPRKARAGILAEGAAYKYAAPKTRRQWARAAAR